MPSENAAASEDTAPVDSPSVGAAPEAVAAGHQVRAVGDATTGDPAPGAPDPADPASGHPGPGRLAALLDSAGKWSGADLDEIEALGLAGVEESLSAIMESQLGGPMDERVLSRACVVAGLLRAEAVVPALVEVATSDRTGEAACEAALDALFRMEADGAAIGPLRDVLVAIRADLESLAAAPDDGALSRSVAIRLGRAVHLLREVCPADEREAILPRSWLPLARGADPAG